MPMVIRLTRMLVSEARPLPEGWALKSYFQGWGEEVRCPTEWPQPELHVLQVEVHVRRGVLIQKGPATYDHTEMRPSKNELDQIIDQVFMGQPAFVPSLEPQRINMSDKAVWLYLET